MYTLNILWNHVYGSNSVSAALLYMDIFFPSAFPTSFYSTALVSPFACFNHCGEVTDEDEATRLSFWQTWNLSLYTEERAPSVCKLRSDCGDFGYKSKTPWWKTRRWRNYLDEETADLNAVATWGVPTMCVYLRAVSRAESKRWWQWVGGKLSHDQFPLFLSHWFYDVARVILCSVCSATENHILTFLLANLQLSRLCPLVSI